MGEKQGSDLEDRRIVYAVRCKARSYFFVPGYPDMYLGQTQVVRSHRLLKAETVSAAMHVRFPSP
jgi:hypothetical protein